MSKLNVWYDKDARNIIYVLDHVFVINMLGRRKQNRTCHINLSKLYLKRNDVGVQCHGYVTEQS